jgi:hypothetical protein
LNFSFEPTFHGGEIHANLTGYFKNLDNSKEKSAL